MTITVPVRFDGTVTVNLPDNLEHAHAQVLAKNFALSRIIATADNPDAPDDYAFDTFQETTGLPEAEAEAAWDAATAEVDGGNWVHGSAQE